MTLQTPRHRAVVAVGLVGGLAALSVGAWALDRWAPFADEPVPVTWSNGLEPLAEFVEEATGLTFTQHVPVEYVDDRAAFDALEDGPPRDDADADADAVDEAFGRALGFWDGDFTFAELADDTGTSDVRWLAHPGRIAIDAKDAAAPMTVADRVDLVVALTQAIDDQAYDVTRRLDAARDPEAARALAALDMGEALWVRDRFVESLPIDDRIDWFRHEDSTRTNDAPPALSGLQLAVPSLGQPFVRSLHESEIRNRVRDAFTSHTPTALDQVSLPVHKYERLDPTESIDQPAAPDGAAVVGTRQLGPVGLHLLLTGGADPIDALAGADGWGNDTFTLYRVGATVCATGRIVADSPADAERMEAALHAWAEHRPPATRASVQRDDDTLAVDACDPGSAQQGLVDDLEVDQYLRRADLLQEQLRYIGLPDVAECAAVRYFEDHTAEAFSDESPDDPFEVVDQLTQTCADER